MAPVAAALAAVVPDPVGAVVGGGGVGVLPIIPAILPNLRTCLVFAAVIAVDPVNAIISS